MAMTLPDLLIDGCHPFLLMHTDCSVRQKALPGKTDHQRLEIDLNATGFFGRNEFYSVNDPSPG